MSKLPLRKIVQFNVENNQSINKMNTVCNKTTFQLIY